MGTLTTGGHNGYKKEDHAHHKAHDYHPPRRHHDTYNQNYPYHAYDRKGLPLQGRNEARTRQGFFHERFRLVASLDAKYFFEAKSIAKFGGRLCFAVSLGRDCACMLHIMSQLTDMKKHAFFTWSFYPKLLPYQARYVAMLEKRYGIKIEVHLNPQLTKTKQMDFVTDFMGKHGCSLALFGYRMDESLQRRGMLKRYTDGIDYVRKWAYPMRSFTRKTIRGYVTSNRIPLNPEYNFGVEHDYQEHRGDRAFMLRHFISEEDYQAAISMDPNVEIDYVRAASKQENREFYKKIFGKELPAW